MGKGKVEHKLGTDGKVRKVGAVGSHSTLVTQAKTPTTNINKVNIVSSFKSDSNNKYNDFDSIMSKWENPDYENTNYDDLYMASTKDRFDLANSWGALEKALKDPDSTEETKKRLSDKYMKQNRLVNASPDSVQSALFVYNSSKKEPQDKTRLNDAWRDWATKQANVYIENFMNHGNLSEDDVDLLFSDTRYVTYNQYIVPNDDIRMLNNTDESDPVWKEFNVWTQMSKSEIAKFREEVTSERLTHPIFRSNR